MDLNTIKQINQEALKAANEGEHGSFLSSHVDNKQLMVYLGAVAVAVATYFLLNKYTPTIVMKTEGDQKSVDNNRVILISALVGAAVVVGYHLYLNY